MSKKLEYVWPVIGLAAVVFSGWLLYHELKGLSAQLQQAGVKAQDIHIDAWE